MKREKWLCFCILFRFSNIKAVVKNSKPNFAIEKPARYKDLGANIPQKYDIKKESPFPNLRDCSLQDHENWKGFVDRCARMIGPLKLKCFRGPILGYSDTSFRWFGP